MIINNKFVCDTVLNKGSFGTVVKGYKINNNKPIVIKFDSSLLNLLKHESFILHFLHQKKVQNIPPVIYYGIYKDIPCLVMPFYDCNLSEYINNNNNIDYNTSILFITLIIQIIDSIHSNFVIHRDIKPQNIMIFNNQPYLIDFGLSIFYIDHEDNHIPDKTINDIVGSYKYCSIHVNLHHTPSRRDDLISISYLLLLLLFKNLPWNHIHNNDYVKRKSLEYILYLCDTKNHFQNIKHFYTYIYNLDFDSKPSYHYIYNLLKTI